MTEKIPNNIKPIPGYEKHYGATPCGKVFSYNYRGTGETRELAQSSLFDKRRDNTTMYTRAKMSFINRNSPTAIHRIIALTFIENPNNYPQVNHIDGDKGNNHVDNLEWCTVRQNIRHAEESGLAVHGKGEDHGGHKLKEFEVREIMESITKDSYRGQQMDLAEKYGVSNYTICDISRKKTWRHLWN